MGSGYRKGRGKGGDSLRRCSWDLRAGACGGQWLRPPALGKASRAALRPDPAQGSADQFGTSVAEVTPVRDVVTERKELDWKPVILV